MSREGRVWFRYGAGRDEGEPEGCVVLRSLFRYFGAGRFDKNVMEDTRRKLTRQRKAVIDKRSFCQVAGKP